MNRELATGLLVVAIAFFVGIWTGKASVEPTVAVTRTVTPQACIDVIQLDNELLVLIGETIVSDDWTSGTAAVQEATSERQALIARCQGGIEL